jgi:hypothetical protein
MRSCVVPLSNGPSVLRPPKPIIEPSDRKIRFRVEDDHGRHSATWMLVAYRNTDDVYFGIRSQMQEIKVSFHEDTWRLALVKESAAAKALPCEHRGCGR